MAAPLLTRRTVDLNAAQRAAAGKLPSAAKVGELCTALCAVYDVQPADVWPKILEAWVVDRCALDLPSGAAELLAGLGTEELVPRAARAIWTVWKAGKTVCQYIEGRFSLRI